jgi:adenylate cyclase
MFTSRTAKSITMQEIERKFKINLDEWRSLEKPAPVHIQQGYLSRDKGCVVRVRVKGSTGYLTVKGKNEGISRLEYEFEIPIQEAIEMLEKFCPLQIIKKRYEINHKSHIWEVDVFEGRHQGLIIAEIELKDENESFEKPIWVTEDVSHNPAFFNSNLG